MTYESKFFGEIDPSARQRVSTTLDTQRNGPVEVELIVHDPAGFNRQFVVQTDAALEYFDEFDRRVRADIESAVTDESTVPAKVRAAQQSLDLTREVTPEAFAASLRAQDVTISPDGGTENQDRIAVTYLAAAGGVRHTFSVILRENEGLVFADDAGAAKRSDPITFG